MVYPGGYKTGREGGTHRKRLTRANEALTWLVTEGFAAVASKRRIYPGPKWAGWNYEPPALPSRLRAGQKKTGFAVPLFGVCGPTLYRKSLRHNTRTFPLPLPLGREGEEP